MLTRECSKRSKLKLYWSVIRPVVTYAYETWVLKENVIQKLMIFERKVLRKVFGPPNNKMVYGESKQMKN
jgi:hypothetical protein